MGCLAITWHFILSALSKMRLWRIWETNVARCLRSFRTHFRLLAIPKYVFSEVEKAMILWVAGHYLRILYILAYPKCDVVCRERNVASGRRSYAHIFAFWLSKKYEINEVEKTTIELEACN